jgi:hypothetical protein
MLHSLNVGQKRSDACAIVDGMNKSSMWKEGSSIAPNSVVIRSARRFFESASPESRADAQPAAAANRKLRDEGRSTALYSLPPYYP